MSPTISGPPTGSDEGEATLRWHYGPTATDPNPGSMWCDDCSGEVWILEDGYICRGCGRQAD